MLDSEGALLTPPADVNGSYASFTTTLAQNDDRGMISRSKYASPGRGRGTVFLAGLHGDIAAQGAAGTTGLCASLSLCLLQFELYTAISLGASVTMHFPPVRGPERSTLTRWSWFAVLIG